MMKFRPVLSLLILISFVIPPALAQNQTIALEEIESIMVEARVLGPIHVLSQDEIAQQLSGNWFEGTGYGDAYRQVFNPISDEDPEALTEYMPRLGGPSVGTWRAEVDQNGTGQYCSNWPPSPNWDCYYIVQDADQGLWWLDEFGNEPQPFGPFEL